MALLSSGHIFTDYSIGIYLSNTSTLHSEADDRLTLCNVNLQECWYLLYKFCVFSSELWRVYPGAIGIGTASCGTRKFGARWEFVTNALLLNLTHTHAR